MISGLIKNQKEYIQYDHRTEEVVDSMELTIKTPEIRVVPTEETLRNQESSDFIVLAGNQETNFEVQEETRQKISPPIDLKHSKPKYLIYLTTFRQFSLLLVV